MLSKIKVLGISGKAGVGKDFISSRLIAPMLFENKRFIQLSFADHFKYEAIVKDKLSRDKVFGKKDEKTRKILQNYGTELGRNKYGDNIWLNIVREKILQESERGINHFIITDVRFPNEKNFIESEMNGFVIRIVAPDRHLKRLQEESSDEKVQQIIANHPSETSLDNQEFKYELDNSQTNLYNVPKQLQNIVVEIEKKWLDKKVIFIDLDDTLVKCNHNYIEIAERVKTWLLQNNKCTEQDFFTYFSIFNDIQRAKPFSREGYAFVMREIAKVFAPEQEYLFYKWGMEVHDKDYIALPGILEKLREWEQKYSIVIITLGDRMDQLRKIFLVNLSGIKTECVLMKNEQTFLELKKKYSGKEYIMIGDSLNHDIIPAYKAKFQKVYLVSEKFPLRDIIIDY